MREIASPATAIHAEIDALAPNRLYVMSPAAGYAIAARPARRYTWDMACGLTKSAM